LMRALLGEQIPKLLDAYEEVAMFYCPDICFDDARFYLSNVLKEKGRDPELAASAINQMTKIVQPVERALYSRHEPLARQRVEMRDADDWAVAAVALLLDLPIWTEDKDFFGSGIATWTTERVELYLRQ